MHSVFIFAKSIMSNFFSFLPEEILDAAFSIKLLVPKSSGKFFWQNNKNSLDAFMTAFLRDFFGGSLLFPAYRSSSLDKIINTTAFVLRLGGRIGKKIPEFFKKMSLEAKYESNPVSAVEHKFALLRLIEHEQKKVDMKKFSGFNLEIMEISVSQSKTLKLVILRSRVKNFPIKFQSEDDLVYVLPVGSLAKKVVENFTGNSTKILIRSVLTSEESSGFHP